MFRPAKTFIRRFVGFVILGSLALAAMPATAREEPSLTIPVWPHLLVPVSQRTNQTYSTKSGGLHERGPISWPTLQVFLAPTNRATGCAIVICPGGAYVEESITLEGYRVARWFNSHGISCFVLKYRLPEGRLPAGGVPWPLQDVRRAVQIVRAHAARWSIDPQHVGVMGFSAGGSVASLAGVHWRPGNPDAKDPLNRISTRPDFLVLGYPVISMLPVITHPLSHNRLLGKRAPLDVDRYFSSELNVTPLTPPAFIFYAHDDTTVNHQNEKRFYQALRRNGIPARLIEFKHGKHGFGLGVPGTDSTRWPQACLEWLDNQGFLTVAKPHSPGRR